LDELSHRVDKKNYSEVLFWIHMHHNRLPCCL
jgi:hypothetical protein